MSRIEKGDTIYLQFDYSLTVKLNEEELNYLHKQMLNDSINGKYKDL